MRLHPLEPHVGARPVVLGCMRERTIRIIDVDARELQAEPPCEPPQSLEWRGPRYLPRGGEGTVSNVTQMLTGISLIFLIAFEIGCGKDRRALQGK